MSIEIVSQLLTEVRNSSNLLEENIINKLNLLGLDPKLAVIHNGVVDYNGDVSIHRKNLSEIPVQFGKVTGFFICYENNLTSLKGCPHTVGAGFYCSENKLTSLKYAPQRVNGDFDCSFNNLTSLQGCQQIIHGVFRCDNNNLTSLQGGPNQVGAFNAGYNKLTSLQGGPKSITGTYTVKNNNLTSCKGAPDKLPRGSFDCSSNNLTSLTGCPKYVDVSFYCYNNPGNFTEQDVRSVCDVDGKINPKAFVPDQFI